MYVAFLLKKKKNCFDESLKYFNGKLSNKNLLFSLQVKIKF